MCTFLHRADFALPPPHPRTPIVPTFRQQPLGPWRAAHRRTLRLSLVKRAASSSQRSSAAGIWSQSLAGVDGMAEEQPHPPPRLSSGSAVWDPPFSVIIRAGRGPEDQSPSPFCCEGGSPSMAGWLGGGDGWVRATPPPPPVCGSCSFFLLLGSRLLW